MSNRRSTRCATTVFIGIATVAGCGSSGGSTICLTGGDDAEVCAEFKDGGADLTANGLAPGSEMVVGFGDPPDGSFIVDENGSVVGAGVLSVFAGAPIDIRIEATAANGDAITGELSDGK